MSSQWSMKCLRLAALAMSACVLAACTPGSSSIEASTSESPNLSKALSSLPVQVQDLMGKTGVPGVAVAVVHDGTTTYAEGFGVANLDTGAKVDADTVFQLA